MASDLDPQRTIGSIVADDYRTAAVFNAHGIDFCCKGGRTIAEVCRTKAIDALWRRAPSGSLTKVVR